LLDHTIDFVYWKCGAQRKFHWDHKGLGTGVNDPPYFTTLEKLFEKNGDLDKKKILKIDCEGCEWPYLDGVDIQYLIKFE
jgi:hypothetical protein